MRLMETLHSATSANPLIKNAVMPVANWLKYIIITNIWNKKYILYTNVQAICKI